VLNGITGSDITLNEGNLTFANNGATDYRAVSTFGMKTGKWYWEMYVNIATTGAGIEIAKSLSDPSSHDRLMDYRQGYQSNGTVNNNLSLTQSGSASSFTTGDIISCTFDLDSSPAVISWYKNDSFQFSLTGTALNGEEWVFMAGFSGTGSLVANFGQDSSFAGNKTAQGNQDSNGIGDFYYTPPTDFLALCTSNLPDPAVIPSEHFNTLLYTGDGSSGLAITGVGFQPDFTWIKKRSGSGQHVFADVLRSDGTYPKTLNSNSSAAEDVNSDGEMVRSLDTDGFTLGDSQAGQGDVNYTDGGTYVSWNWKAGGSGSSNTDGSITSTVSANQDAGFSIVSYTGNVTAGATVGHGLSSAPEMIIVKGRESLANWAVLHKGIASDYETDYIAMNNAYVVVDNVAYWNDTKPTNALFSLGDDNDVNKSGEGHIAYCFHSVDGYSKVGSYTGNGDADGTFVYTGFRPMWLMIKDTASSEHWMMFDSERSTYNVVDDYFKANDVDTEDTDHASIRVDFLSNGFKARGSNAGVNDSETMVYLAFAEQPFKHSNAR
jgi:hypothetical protein